MLLASGHALRPRTSLVPPLLLSALACLMGCQGDKASSPTDAATGAGDSGGAASSMPGCPASTETEVIDPTTLIDNFENGTTNLLPAIGGRVGGWYSVGDGTPAATLQPSGVVAPETISGGRCGSRHALHLTGGGFLNWGAQLLTPLSYGANDAGVATFLPYDGSRYRGITFFARIGDTSGASVRFAVADEYARPEAGLCDLGGAFGKGCYDTFGVDLAPSLGTSWRQFHIPFSGLAPLNFGLHGKELDTSMIYDLQFDVAPNVIFDLWVDDISFY